jgi:hypothetical protein
MTFIPLLLAITGSLPGGQFCGVGVVVGFVAGIDRAAADVAAGLVVQLRREVAEQGGVERAGTGISGDVLGAVAVVGGQLTQPGADQLIGHLGQPPVQGEEIHELTGHTGPDEPIRVAGAVAVIAVVSAYHWGPPVPGWCMETPAR